GVSAIESGSALGVQQASGGTSARPRKHEERSDPARMPHGACTMPHSRENLFQRCCREVVSLFPTRSRPQSAGVRVLGRVACPPNGGCAARPHTDVPTRLVIHADLTRAGHAACAGIEVLVWVSALSRFTYTSVGWKFDASASSSPAYAQMITRS